MSPRAAAASCTDEAAESGDVEPEPRVQHALQLGTCRLGVRADGGRPKVRDADGRSRLDLNYS